MSEPANKAPSEKKRKGCGWIGILFALLTIVVLSSVLMSAGFIGLKADPRSKAHNLAYQLTSACEAYQKEYSVLPATPENYQLLKILNGANPRSIQFISLRATQFNSNGEVIDPWETPLRITFDPDSKIHATSAGPDKIFGTADDISNQ